MAKQPHLSICIPTYNRAAFLEANLRTLAQMRFPFEVEVVVSDNASTDRTSQVAFDAARALPALRYARQETNTGIKANYLAACRMATGRFLIYLADDDSVFPDELVHAVGVVAADPGLAAFYSPHEYWDFRNNKRYGQHWAIQQDRFFDRGQSLDLLAFVMEHRINPEIAVYRTEALHRVLRTHDGAYWAYPAMVAMLATARVGFSSRCYYKFDSRPETGGINANSGRHIVVNAYQEIRTGLEYLVAAAYEMAGQSPAPWDAAQRWREGIDNFILGGIADTFLALLLAHNYLGVHDLACRLAGGGRSARELILRLDPGFETKLIADFVIHSCAAMTTIDTLLIHLASPLGAIVQALAQTVPRLATQIATSGDLRQQARAGVAVVIDKGAYRQELVEQGFLPGLIFAEDEIRAFLKFPAAQVPAPSPVKAG